MPSASFDHRSQPITSIPDFFFQCPLPEISSAAFSLWAQPWIFHRELKKRSVPALAKVQEWLGHANVSTTRLYDRRKSRAEKRPHVSCILLT